ncbi:MAG: TrkA family potassium uptake protein [Magnetococcales bacterium]|nr:TrkA family potassium uptake protein [Magnetococcales bacterium]MBF0150253.1 TrkA family potassium uptake protein [Magnetococcales bacterium]MBF0172166.1 TrkA family potassium uptake protein [Magnetococcales bacterium]MBF0347148.1 TrkA family potassium uptake protein [Magnetococcales bacterium]MBF0630535.1 TrkA family potassium uptake protein [Magnetococcales bacterium]
MSHTYLVVGLGTFGSRVAKALFDEEAYVLAVDHEEGRVNAMREFTSKAVCCDAINAEAMRAVGAFEVDTAIVALRNHFDMTVLVTHSLRKHGITHILVQVDNEQEAEAIQSFGATEVIFPPRDMALRIAKRLIHPDLAESIPLGHGMAIIDILCPPSFVGRTIRTVELRAHYGVNLIGIRSDGQDGKETLTLNPTPDTPLRGEDNLILLGTLDQLTKVKGLVDGHGGGADHRY